MQALPDAVAPFQSLGVSVLGLVPPEGDDDDNQQQSYGDASEDCQGHEVVG